MGNGHHRKTMARRLLPTLAAVLLITACSAADKTAEPDTDGESQGWRWPDQPSRVNPNQPVIDRSISVRRPSIAIPPVRLGGKQLPKPIPQGFSVFPPPQQQQPAALPKQPVNQAVPPPASQLSPQRAPLPPPASTPTTTTKAPPATVDVADSEVAGGTANKSSVPLLIDAGKPGNPYVLLNKEFPPENSIRTQGQEEAILEDLRSKDLGGLDPEEVWLADNDLFVVRGFNYKVPYSADAAGKPIHDYDAPAPRPPPPPEPGTAFYPTNQTEIVFNFPGAPDFNSTDPGRLPAFPYPFLPPPPPQWHEEKEFNDKNPNHLFDNFNVGPGQGGNNNNIPPNGPGFPPPSGLNGFPGAPPGGPGSQPGAGPPSGPPPINFTLSEDDEDIPFTPLFAERPVEYYFPDHNTSAKPPGPFGPGVFVPPPVEYFAPRDPNEIIDVKIPQKLFRPPFSLPNYYAKQQQKQQQQPGSSPVWPQRLNNQQIHPAGFPSAGFPGQQQQFFQNPAVDVSRPAAAPVKPIPAAPKQPQQTPSAPAKSVAKPTQEIFKEPVKTTSGGPIGHASAIFSAAPGVAVPGQVQVFNPVLLDTNFKEVPSLPEIEESIVSVPVTPQDHQYYVPHPYPYYQKPEPVKPPHSLEGDTDVNFQYPRPPIDPDSEFIDPTKLLAPWDPYTIRSQQRPSSSPSWPYPRHYATESEEPNVYSKKPGNFVSVYRQGGGSYSYKLNS